MRRARRAATSSVLGLLAVTVLSACADGERADRTPPAEAPVTTVPSMPSPDPSPGPPRSFTVTGARAGFATGWELTNDRSPAAVAADLDAIASTGVQWLRVAVLWDEVERVPGAIDWGPTDRMVEGARARGLSVLAMVSGAPDWTRAEPCGEYQCPPDDPAAYGRFVRAVAERYSPRGVHHFELWNEPNHRPFFGPRPDVDRYAALLAAGAAAVRAVDPVATVVSGGLSPAPDAGGEIAPVTFLRALYERGAGRFFDAVGHHPYHYPDRPVAAAEPGANALLDTPRLHEVMVEHGDGAKRIWGTETGAPTRGPWAVTEADQAVHLRDYYDTWNAWSFTGPLLWYTARDRAPDGDTESSYGLWRTDRSPKPALGTFLDLVASAPPVADRSRLAR